MSEPLEALAAPIHAAICYDSWEECCNDSGGCFRAAKVQLGRGVRPPARVIATAEELDVLPFASLLLDQWRTVWQRQLADWQPLAISRADAPLRVVLLGTVLWTPAAHT